MKINKSSGLAAWSMLKVDGPVMAGVTVTGDTVYAGAMKAVFTQLTARMANINGR